ncbi:hypothetical protein B0I35DRAFT_437711 [Stachybotrys elegans]|uniref:Secreted LysM effector LysM C-terminal domain-containing protein n=1 Tax=Stachybotrys elegans TaxID=80388 RepID=A0A8K0SKU4_9HYPO|nr:hypothetical protein B0I35DRAFT_437711 [Stachybotrys elegans]
MKFSLIPAALLASTAGAWTVTVYENTDCNDNPTRYYAIDGTGSRTFNPWSGGSTSGFDFCRIFWNGGRNWKSCSEGSTNFRPNSISVVGNCKAVSGSETTQFFAGRPACNKRGSRNWGKIQCSG